MKACMLVVVTILSFSTVHAQVPCSGTPNPGTSFRTPMTGTDTTLYTLKDTTYSSVTGLSFQWQASPGCVTWTNISGATNPTYANYFPGIDTICFCLVVTCTNSGLSSKTCVFPLVTDKLDAASDVEIYPNPVGIELALKGSTAGFSEFRIIDLVGNTVEQGALLFDRPTIQTKNLIKGIYLLRLSGPAGIRVLRFSRF